MCLQQDRGRKTRQLDSLMTSLNDLAERGRMTWAAKEEGWTGRPEEVLDALATERMASTHANVTCRQARTIGVRRTERGKASIPTRNPWHL